MEITIVVDDNLIEKKAKEVMADAINSLVRECVQYQIGSYKNKVDKAVELYLAKRLTNEEVSSVIETAVKRIVEEKLRHDSDY